MPPHPNQGALSRGRTKVFLLRELAMGAVSKGTLAERLGVSVMAISVFEKRHAAEIALVRADLENKWAGLWIAEKRDRLAELQQMYEDNDVLLADGAMMPADANALRRVQLSILDQAAKELGDLPKPLDQNAAQAIPVYMIYGSDLDPQALV